jgi:hypothetical protein
MLRDSARHLSPRAMSTRCHGGSEAVKMQNAPWSVLQARPRAHRHRRRIWALVIGALLLLASSNGRMPALQNRNAARLFQSNGQAWIALSHGYSAAGIAPARGASPRQYWQVGLSAGPEAAAAVAMRTAIVTRLPQAVPERTTDYFWIGSYLADGSFIQVGYYVAWSDPGRAGWFYCAYTAAGVQGPCVYGPPGSAGSDGQTHTYALEAIPPDRAATAQPGSALWVAQVDGAVVGQFRWTSGTTGRHSPSIYAESSGFTPHLPTAQLGPVEFPGAVQTRTADGSAYVTATHLQPMYAAPDVCPPYGVAVDGHGGVFLGSGLPCPAGDRWLW